MAKRKLKSIKPGRLFIVSRRRGKLYDHERMVEVQNEEKLIVTDILYDKWVTTLDSSGDKRAFRIEDFLVNTRPL